MFSREQTRFARCEGVDMASPAAGETASPAREYAHRLQVRRDEETRLMRLHRTLVRGKGVTVGLIVTLALLAEKEPAATVFTLLLFPSVLALALMARRWRAARALDRARRAARYFEDRLACLEGRWAGRGEAGARYLTADHPAAEDLDLFGTGSLFELLCTAHTRPGQDTLAAWLTAPADEGAVRARQAAVTELRPRLEFREDLAVLGSTVPGRGHFAALARWAKGENGLALPLPVRGAVWVVPLLTLVALVGWGMFGTGFVYVVAALILQAGLALWLRGYAAHHLAPAEAGMAALRPLAGMLALPERERLASPRLRQLADLLHAADRPASELLKRLHRILNWGVPATLVGCRPQLALYLGAWQKKRGRALSRWLEALGELEAVCALATHAHENPEAVFAEVVGQGPCFEAEGLGHPLLPRDRCVRNDVSLGGDVRLLVVSGSNMSGKSTFLRAVGINTALALAGAPVRATRLRLSPLLPGATLRVQDSLQAGRSRFYAEALRVRQLLDLAAGPVPLLFLLDELFQGTNSQDRRVGAEAVLRRLLDRGAVGLVTTHDLALTALVDRLPRSANVHFEDRFTDGTLSFDYRLRPGVVPTSNGLALLRAVGIEV
jgi:hypothetical protein